MPRICETPRVRLASLRARRLIASLSGGPRASSRGRGAPARKEGRWLMQDIWWVLVIVGLLALTLAYVRLCERA